MTKRMLMLLSSFMLLPSMACAGYAVYEETPPTRVVYIERRPPVARVEVIGVAPGPGYVWVAGTWGWGGTEYYWTPGRWAAPPQPIYTVYVQGEWRQARGRGWYYAPGHWKKGRR